MADLRELMHAAAATPRTPVDIEGVVAQGRRARTMKAVAISGVVVAALVATTSAIATWPTSRPRLVAPPPDSSEGRIGFVRFAGSDGSIVSIDVDGNNPYVHYVSGDLGAAEPAWSPDGSMIAFLEYHASNDPPEFKGHRGSSSLFVMNADGSEKRRIIEGGYSPAWSPDGRRILFPYGGTLHVYSLDDGEMTPLGFSGDDPDWSTHGSITFGHRSLIEDENYGIWVADEDGSNARRIVGPDDDPGREALSGPQWSPDGTQIVFQREQTLATDHGVDTTIEIVDADGSNRRALTTGTQPTWSPDGRRIAFVRDDGRGTHLYSINVDGTGLEQLTFGATSDFSPDWTSATPPPQQAWRGIWPFDTREQAERAQRLAARGRNRYEEFLIPDVLSYGVLAEDYGWMRFFPSQRKAQRRIRPGVIVQRYFDCSAPPDCERKATIRLEQLVRVGSGGIWVVTSVEEIHQIRSERAGQ